VHQIRSGAIDEAGLSAIESQDNIFPFDIYNMFHSKPDSPRHRAAN